MKKARVWLWGLGALAVMSALGAILTGRTLDDTMHPFVLAERGPFGLYDFLGPSDVPHHRSTGFLPWWTSPALSMRFFRPLSSLDLALDHLYLDGGGLLSHIHGLLWFVLLIALSYHLFAALVGQEAARFATPLYALASWHTMSLAFVAARHTVVTACLAVGCFALFVRFVEKGHRSALWGSTLAFALALLAGESALLVVPLLLGWAIARRGFRPTLLATAPIVSTTLLYLCCYISSDWGAQGSSLYLSPKTWLFWRELPFRWLSLAGDLFGSLATDSALLGARPIQLVWGVLSLLAGWRALRWLWSRERGQARNLAGLVLGALGALVPASAAMPGGRSLVVVGLAASALFGKVLATWLTATARGESPRWVGAWVLLFGVGLHPLFRAVIAWDLRRQGRDMIELAERVETACAGRLVLAVGTLDMNISFVPYILASSGRGMPSAIHVLSMAPGRHELRRLRPGRYELAIAGDFFASMWSRNHSTQPLRVGTKVELEHATVSVIADRAPTRLALELDSVVAPCWVTSGPSGIVFLDSSVDVSRWTPTKIR